MIQIEHKGYAIFYDEDRNEWVNNDADIRSQKLSVVRARIDAMEKSDRAVKVSALHIRYWNQVVPVTITLLCAPEKKYGDPTERVRSVWAIDANGNRQKVDLDNLAMPDAADMLAKVKEHMAAAERERDAADDLLKSIPRLTVEAIRAASKVNSHA